MLGLAALVAACGNGEEPSLRDSLARLPRDTTPTRAESAAAAASLPVDTSLLRYGTEPSLDDTLPLPVAVVEPSGADAPDGGPADDEEFDGEPADTGRNPLRPGPPRDTEPWIPESRPLTVSDEWRETTVAGEGRVQGIATLESVRAARNDDFDRLVLEFRGGALPGYRVEYVDPPVRQCGSGQVVPLRGDAWLRIRLDPARAHDERGRATVSDRSRQTDLPSVREMQLICDYEGQVEWILGLSDRHRFRVTELSNPSRLVVDVLH